MTDAQEEADGRQEGSGGGTGQQQPQQQQQGQQGATPTGDPSSRGEGGGAPPGRGRNNVRVINFPSVQVMMTRGPPGSNPGGGAAGTGQAASGGANPQMPPFGPPMLFGLPM